MIVTRPARESRLQIPYRAYFFHLIIDIAFKSSHSTCSRVIHRLQEITIQLIALNTRIFLIF